MQKSKRSNTQKDLVSTIKRSKEKISKQVIVQKKKTEGFQTPQLLRQKPRQPLKAQPTFCLMKPLPAGFSTSALSARQFFVGSEQGLLVQ